MEYTTNIEPGQLGSAQLDAEQAYISMLYDRLDEARARTVAALRTQHARRTGTRPALFERGVAADEHDRRLAPLPRSGRALFFGRLRPPGAPSIGPTGVASSPGPLGPARTPA